MVKSPIGGQRGRYMKKKMKMQLFGSFCLENEKARLDEEMLHSRKLTRLLAYIIFYRDRNISHQELIDIFWEDDAKNPQGALKNLIYRLRTSLKIFGEEEYIDTLSGAYRWNPDILVETDYEQFEKLAAAVRIEKNDEKRKELCREIIAGYKINISEMLGGESWVLPKITWYRSAYMDVVKELGSIYEREEAWTNLEALCNEALSMDSLDEDLNYWIIKSLWGQNKNDLAMLHYENVSKMLYDSLGIRTTEKLQSIFKEILNKTDGKVADIGSLIEEVKEPEKPKGAFFCDYQNFRQIYRVESRRNNRLGIAEYVLLLTLRRSGGAKRKPSEDSGLMEGMTILGNLLRDLLRMGDVAARYSLTQYIVMLPTCSYESGVMVAERIRSAFLKNIGKKHIELVYELEELTNTE